MNADFLLVYNADLTWWNAGNYWLRWTLNVCCLWSVSYTGCFGLYFNCSWYRKLEDAYCPQKAKACKCKNKQTNNNKMEQNQPPSFLSWVVATSLYTFCFLRTPTYSKSNNNNNGRFLFFVQYHCHCSLVADGTLACCFSTGLVSVRTCRGAHWFMSGLGFVNCTLAWYEFFKLVAEALSHNVNYYIIIYIYISIIS